MAWLLLALLAGPRARAQSAPTWQAAIAAAGDVQVQAVATDASGNVLLAGGFSGGTATFGATSLSSPASQEVFVAKWSPASSSFVWAVQGNSPAASQSAVTGLATSAGLVYVAGNFTGGSLTLGGTTALANAQAGTSDLFVARLADNTSSASFGWSRRAGGPGNDYANALTFSNNYVQVGGSSAGNATFGTGTTATLAAAGGFVAYYSANGAFTGSPVPAGSSVTGLAVSGSSSGLYATGTFNSSANTFIDNTRSLASAGGEDIFVLRLAYLPPALISGANYWAQRAGGPGNDYPRAVAIGSGSVYVTGSYASASATFGSTTLTNPGAGNLFVAKLADAPTAGVFSWALQSGGSADAATSGYGLSTYGSSVYLAGAFGGTASLGSTTLTSAGSSDVLLAKLTDSGSSGAFVWVQQAGGAGPDGAAALARTGQQLYVGGRVTAPASFGSQSIGTAAGVRPGFLATLADPAPLLTLSAPGTGTVGSTITLYGSNLTGATAITFTGTSGNVVTSGFAVNAAGTQITNVVVPAGAQSGAVNVTTLQGTSNGLVSYVVLTNPNPAPSWQAALASAGGAIRYATPDASGNILVAGTFSNTLALGSTTLASAGGTDVFVAKYSPASNSYVWAQRAGSTAADDIFGLSVQGSNVYLTGLFYGLTATFGSTTLTSAQGYAGYVAKLTDAGSSAGFTWAVLLDDSSQVFVESLAVSGSSVYVGGDYTGSTLLLGTGSLSGNASGDDGFVAKFTDNGSSASFNWVRGAGSSDGSTINVYGLAVQGSTVYAAGYLYGTVAFGSTSLASAGSGDVAVVRLSDQGTTAAFTSGVRAGGTGNEFVLGFTRQGNALYATGFSSSSTWPGTAAASNGGNDGFVLKVTDGSAGLAVSWAQLLGGPGEDRTYQVVTNGTGVYVAGYFSGTASLGGSTLASAGGLDGFVARLVDAGSSASVSWAQQNGGFGGDINYALALTSGRVYVGGTVTPAAAFGALAITSPAGVPTATLATLADPAVLAAATPAPAASLALYPNPAHETATVPLPTGASGALQVLDPLGREVRRQPVAAGAAEVQLDLRGLAPGLYLVRVPGTSAARHLLVE